MDSKISSINLSYFPQQKISSREKTKDWACKCIDAASSIIFARPDWIRQTMYNKKANFNLANNILDEQEIHKVFNPMGIQFGEFPTSIQHFNKSMSKIDLLVGEELKRPFEFKVIALNPDAVSSREELKVEQLLQLAQEEIKSKEFDPQKVEKKIKELDKYYNYNYQSLSEKIGSDLLNYHWYIDRFQYKFNQGFMNMLISAEECYRTDIISGNPVMELCNPLNLFTLRNGSSPYLEDSEIIVEICYLPVGKVIEEFYDELKNDEIDFLEQGNYNMYMSSQLLNYSTLTPIFRIPDEYMGRMNNQGILEPNSSATRWYGGWFNEHGEVRVVRCRWKSRIKKQILTYYDEYGFQQEEIVSEFYVPDKNKGEKTRVIWGNQCWEGVKIAQDIYVKIRPRPVQFSNIGNPAISQSGYVGTYYNVNDNKSLSLMDRMKPFQFLYNLFWHKMLIGISLYNGPKEVLPTHLKPSSWSQDQWLYYNNVLNKIVIDPFNEGTEGFAKGTLAGSYNQFLPQIIDSSAFGNYIGQLQNLIDYVDRQIGEISGINREREGATSNVETVGGTERRVTQSSLITERYFYVHEDVKLRALQAFLDTARVAYRDRKDVKIQYITDDMGVRTIQFNGDDFAFTELGIKAINSSRFNDIRQKYDMLIQAGLQNDKISFAQAMEIYNSQSMSHIRNKIETWETEKLQAAQDQFKQEMDSKVKEQQVVMDWEREKHEDAVNLEGEKMQHDMDVKLLEIELKREELGDKKASDELWARIQEQQNRLNKELGEKKLEVDKRIKENKSKK